MKYLLTKREVSETGFTKLLFIQEARSFDAFSPLALTVEGFSKDASFFPASAVMQAFEIELAIEELKRKRIAGINGRNLDDVMDLGKKFTVEFHFLHREDLLDCFQLSTPADFSFNILDADFID